MFGCFYQIVEKCNGFHLSSLPLNSSEVTGKLSRDKLDRIVFIPEVRQSVVLRFKLTQLDSSRWSGREPLSQCLEGLAW